MSQSLMLKPRTRVFHVYTIALPHTKHIEFVPIDELFHKYVGTMDLGAMEYADNAISILQKKVVFETLVYQVPCSSVISLMTNM